MDVWLHDSGELSDEYDLVIDRVGDTYTVSWFTDGNLGAVGVGMEVEHGLAVPPAQLQEATDTPGAIPKHRRFS